MATSKAAKNKTYWERKQDAFKNFGKAETRPQENFRDYLLNKRRLNLGLCMDVNRENRNSQSFKVNDISPPVNLPPHSLPYCAENWKLVDTEHDFNIMMEYLKSVSEFTLDIEQNQDHSYHGMTCWIQIGTQRTNYLVDPFPLFKKLNSEFKDLMQSSRQLKIMHGCVNDIFALKRDFGIVPAGVVDVQILYQQIQLTFADKSSTTSLELMYDKDGIICRITGLSSQRPPTSTDIHDLKNSAKQGIGLSCLVSKFFPGIGKPDDATLADWRIRPLVDVRMITYAVYDVHTLFCVWQQLKNLIISTPLYYESLTNSVEGTKQLLNKPVPLRRLSSFDEEVKGVKRGGKKPNPSVEKALCEFRNLHAQIMDEPPNEILTVKEIVTLPGLNVTTSEELSAAILRLRNHMPESYASWSKAVLQILIQGPGFWEKMKNRRDCHVCQGRHDYGHLAWGCIEPYSARAVTEFMSRDENQRFREREYERRLANWQAKYGNKPCPYLKHP